MLKHSCEVNVLFLDTCFILKFLFYMLDLRFSLGVNMETVIFWDVTLCRQQFPVKFW